MPVNKSLTAPDWVDPDDAPDLSSPDYRAKFAAQPVRRGRPKAETTKVPIGLRLAADVVESLKASGPGYNARVEEALRKAGFGAAKTKPARKTRDLMAALKKSIRKTSAKASKKEMAERIAAAKKEKAAIEEAHAAAKRAAPAKKRA
jgi:uncharacterized protein (DUF4415 family)